MKSILLILWYLFWHGSLLSFDDVENCVILHSAISTLSFEQYLNQLPRGKTSFLHKMRGCRRHYGDSVIHTWARFNGEPVMLEYLRKKVKLSIFDATSVGETPLMLAAANGNIKAVQALLATLGATPGYINQGDKFGRTALHRAVMGNYVHVLAELIAAGGSVHLEDNLGISVAWLVQKPRFAKCRTAFYRNAPKEFFDEPLLERTSDDDSVWSDRSSLLLSPEVSSQVAMRDRKEVLLEREPALHRAVILNDLAMLKSIVSSEVVNQPDGQGNTVVHYFAEFGNDEKILKFLRKKGANIMTKNRQGQTPLMLAVSVENILAIKLLTNDKTVNLQDRSNRTALHYAVLTQNERLIEWLLNNKADSWFVDSFNRTALEYAKELGLSRIFHRLKQSIHVLTLSKEPEWECVRGEKKSSRGCSLFGGSSSKKKRDRSFSASGLSDYPFVYGGICLFE